MPKPVWAPRARKDLREIILYVAQDSPQTAAIVNERILNAVDLLAKMPKSGRPGRVPGTRERVVGRTPFLLIYTFESTQVRILRVLRGARKWP